MVTLVAGLPVVGIWARPCTRRTSKTKFAVAKDGLGGDAMSGSSGLPRGIASRRMWTWVPSQLWR